MSRRRGRGGCGIGAPVRVHRARNLVEEDRRVEEGIPVTSVARTYLDLAEVARSRAGSPKLLEARRRSEDASTYYEVHACCERSRGHRGREAAAPRRWRSTGPTPRHPLRLRAATSSPWSKPPACRCRRPTTSSAAYELDAYWPERRLRGRARHLRDPRHPRLLRVRPRTRRRARRGRDHDRSASPNSRLDSRPGRRRRASWPRCCAARPAAARRRRASPPSPV